MNEKKNIIICFSGYRSHTLCLIKTDLENKGKSLGANIQNGEFFDLQFITHLISPSNGKTIKTLVAHLTGKWVMNSQWIEDSYKKGYWIDELNYGIHIILNFILFFIPVRLSIFCFTL